MHNWQLLNLLRIPARERARRRPLRFEALERRHLLDAHPLITEFMADNNETLADGDGNFTDWVEIYNDGDMSLDLAGYHLTDDANQLNKWTFPSAVLDPGEYLIVFASGQPTSNYVDAGGNFHTNFALNADGEYLALLEPDGLTIASEFTPEAPSQFADTSYGLRQDTVESPILNANANTSILVPTASDDQLIGTNWRQRSFVEGAAMETPWTLGTTGVGFAVDATSETLIDEHVGANDPRTEGWSSGQPGTPVFNDQGSGIDAWRISDPSAVFPRYDRPLTSIEAANMATDGWRMTATLRNHLLNQNADGLGNFIEVSLASVGQWSLSIGSDSAGNPTLFRADACCLGNNGQIFLDASVTGNGYHTYEMLYDPNISTTEVEVFVDGISHGMIPPAPSNFGNRFNWGSSDSGSDWDANWSLVRLVSGLSGSSVAPLIATDIEHLMYQQNATAYLRIPFTAGDQSNIDDMEQLVLRSSHDDGFVAFINGVEVASSNAPGRDGNPGTLGFNSSAAAQNDALSAEDFAIDLAALNQGTGALLPGNNANLLAIHGLNTSFSDDDFLALPELHARAVTTFPSDERFFITPTPGAPNENPVLGFVADTNFNVDRGFFSVPFDVEITTATAGASIVYTTDGSAPTVSPAGVATNGTVYTGPVNVSTTTTLRAMAWKTDFQSTNIDTQTYIRLDDVIQQPATPAGFPANWTSAFAGDYALDPNVVNDTAYSGTIIDDLQSLPTMSLVMDVDDWFGQSSDPASGGIIANTQGRGRAWEKLVSAEWLPAAGDPSSATFQIDAGIRVHGNGSRNLNAQPKTSFRLSFRNDYGDARLDFPLFDDSQVASFDSLVLRGGYDDGWSGLSGSNSAYLRNQWLADTQLAMGQASTYGSFVHLYINGLYWGVYNISERPDADFHAAYFGGQEEQYDAVNVFQGTSNPDAIDGDLVAWDQMMAISDAGLSSNAQYTAIQEYLDVPNLIDYMILNVFGGNQHWPNHNWYAGRKRESGAGFRFFSWDGEGVFLNVNHDQSTVGNVASELNSPARLYHQLRQNSDFHVLFGDHVHRHFFNDGALTSSAATARWAAMADSVRSGMVAESARWGDHDREPPYERDADWEATIASVQSIIQERNAIVLDQFRAIGLYSNLEAPVFSQHGGAINAGFNLTITNPGGSGTVWFTIDGSDPRDASGNVAPSASMATGAIPISSTTTVKARVLDGAAWSALNEAVFAVNPATANNLRITEVNYHPHDALFQFGDLVTDANNFEFVELENTSAATVQLSGTQFVQVSVGNGTEGISFTFADQQLPPGERIVVVRDRVAFQSRYGANARIADGTGAQPADGVYDGKLSNGGEQLTLLDVFGQTIQQFTYDDDGAWPVRADGGGSSLEAIDLQGDYNDPNNWRSSIDFGGSPDAVGRSPEHSVLINEVVANSEGAQVDTVELVNTSGNPVNISNWYLSNSQANYFKYQVPATTTIQAGAHVTFDESHFNATGGVNPNDFSLSAIGDDVWLLSAEPNGRPLSFMDDVSFGGTFVNSSIGRVPDASLDDNLLPLSGLSLGSANAPHRFGEVIISEVHYHPEEPPIGSVITDSQLEFVELFNRTGRTINVSGWRVNNSFELVIPAGTVLGPGRTLVLVSFDPANTVLDAEFRALYGSDPSTVLVGPWTTGTLDNGGEKVTLEMPDSEEVAYIAIDQIDYDDDAPWPPSTDGTGDSLHRQHPAWVGRDAGSFSAAAPTPGEVDWEAALPGDTDFDDDVDITDFVRLVRNFSPMATDKTRVQGDMDGDQDVDIADFNVIAANFNPLGGSSPIRTASAPRELSIVSISPQRGRETVQTRDQVRPNTLHPIHGGSATDQTFVAASLYPEKAHAVNAHAIARSIDCLSCQTATSSARLARPAARTDLMDRKVAELGEESADGNTWSA